MAAAIVNIRALKATVLTLILNSLFLNSAGSVKIGISYRRGFRNTAEGGRVGFKNKV
jgi:hypothetical protein